MSRLAAAYGRLSASSFIASKLGSYRIVVPFHFSTGEKKDLEFQGLFLRWCPRETGIFQ
jgi:hypothetical protein